MSTDEAPTLAGVCIFTVSPERAAEIFSEDPGVKAGIFSFEVHPVGGFPGPGPSTEQRGGGIESDAPDRQRMN